MPFDYNSFMQGVQTGLRLGRTKLGRQPPVPSGRYILTESGEHVIAERMRLGEVSVYNMGTTYTCTGYASESSSASVVQTGISMNISLFDPSVYPAPGYTNAQILFWKDTRVNMIDCVLFLQGPIYYYGSYEFAVNGVTNYFFDVQESYLQQAGDYRWGILNLIPNSLEPEMYLRIDGATMFEGNRQDLESLFINASGNPMITEGG